MHFPSIVRGLIRWHLATLSTSTVKASRVVFGANWFGFCVMFRVVLVLCIRIIALMPPLLATCGPALMSWGHLHGHFCARLWWSHDRSEACLFGFCSCSEKTNGVVFIVTEMIVHFVSHSMCKCSKQEESEPILHSPFIINNQRDQKEGDELEFCSCQS
jgi:hypothetical protein